MTSTPQAPSRASAAWAIRALWREIGGFRFQFEAEAVPGAQLPGSLVYHLDSPTLFCDAMRLDANGIPYQRSRTFTSYNPAYVAWHGLQGLQAAELHGHPGGRAQFLRQVEWLRTHVVRRADGAAVWPYDFDWVEYDSFLPAGWISGMAQGLAISALVRAHRLSPDPSVLALARAAGRPFGIAVADGGTRSEGRSGPLLEEYPAVPPPRVLDGTLFAMLGAYDLAQETGDPALWLVFEELVAGLLGELSEWDFHGKWSWYGRRLYLSPPHYHAVNTALLLALSRAAKNATFGELASRWGYADRGLLDRAHVYLTFVLTKQRSRVRARLLARQRRVSRG